MTDLSPERPSLNKRQVLSGLRCHRLLWWLIHEKESPELKRSAETLVRFAEGQLTDEYARRFMGASGPERLFQPAYEASGVNIRADALEQSDGSWTLVEVKSTKSPKDAKDRKKKVEEHTADLAVQTATIRAAGVPIARSHLMLLNRDCRHPNLDNLFVREDVTAEVDAEATKVLPAVAELHQMLRAPLPTVAVGAHCTDPEECPFHHRCHEQLPDHHVSELYYAKARAAKFVSQGKTLVSQLDETDAPNEPARRQVRSVRSGVRVVESTLGAALAELKTPLVHLDFETVQLAVPRWPGCAPQDMVAVQFSVHRERPDGSVEHIEHLARRGGDPRPALIHELIEACRGAATILVYYEQFEKSRINELAASFPEYAAALDDIHDRIKDLLPIVREHVYDPGFHGSFSLKKVLPALVPGLGYSDLRIQEGGSAAAGIYRLLFDEKLDAAGQDALRADLLAYCKRDTEAMVRLLGVLRALAT
jgi:hypothetical protein